MKIQVDFRFDVKDNHDARCAKLNVLEQLLKNYIPDEIGHFNKDKLIEFVVSWYFMSNVDTIKEFSDEYEKLLGHN